MGTPERDVYDERCRELVVKASAGAWTGTANFRGGVLYLPPDWDTLYYQCML